MNLVITLTFKILILVIIGYIAKVIGIIDDVGKDTLSSLLVNLFLPVSMIASSQQKFDITHLRGVASVALIALIYYIITFLIGRIIARICGMDTNKSAMFILLIAFANTGFVGMSVLTELIGETGTLYGAIYNSVFDILYFSYGISIISSEGRFDRGKIIKNPMIWIAIITTILYVIPYRMPAVMTDSFNLVGNCMMPVSMIIIGAEIANMNIRQVLTDKASYGVSLIRMLIIPSITLGIMKLFNVNYEVMVTATILAAMPSGSLNVIMGQKYNNNAQFAVKVVMQNTIIMIVTLPIFAYLIMR